MWCMRITMQQDWFVSLAYLDSVVDVVFTVAMVFILADLVEGDERVLYLAIAHHMDAIVHIIVDKREEQALLLHDRLTAAVLDADVTVKVD